MTLVRPTVANQWLADLPENYADVSLLQPDEQFDALSAMIEADDAANPAPFTGTPPWGEPTNPDEYTSEYDQENEYLLPPDLEQQYDRNAMRSLIEDAPSADIPEWDWENDDQYFGLGVPPGAPAVDQPFETGHTQHVLPDSSMNRGMFAWSGKPTLARTARHENAFRSYNAGTSRGHMIPVEKISSPYYLRTNLARNLLLAEINRRGIHNVTIQDVPAPSFAESTMMIDPTTLAPEPAISDDTGVLP